MTEEFLCCLCANSMFYPVITRLHDMDSLRSHMDSDNVAVYWAVLKQNSMVATVSSKAPLVHVSYTVDWELILRISNWTCSYSSTWNFHYTCPNNYVQFICVGFLLWRYMTDVVFIRFFWYCHQIPWKDHDKQYFFIFIVSVALTPKSIQSLWRCKSLRCNM